MKVSSVSVLTIIAFILGIIGIAVPLAIFITSIQYKTENSYYGNIGDWFGGIAGPLLSFSSFIIVYVALRLQSKESNEQKAESLIQQNLASIKRFEESFFYLFAQLNLTINQLWTRYTKTVERVEKDENGGTVTIKDINTLESKGRRVFSNVLNRLRDTTDEINEKSLKVDALIKVKKAYSIVYDIEEANLGLYFKSLQQILVYVEKTEFIPGKDKPFYINIIKNNISDIEKIILYYHINSNPNSEYDQLTELSSKYGLTNNLKKRLLLLNEHSLTPLEQ